MERVLLTRRARALARRVEGEGRVGVIGSYLSSDLPLNRDIVEGWGGEWQLPMCR